MPLDALRRLRSAVDARPRVSLAIKAALTAALAWLCVQPLGGVADDYPYYAPLGAVIAVTSTFAHSVRSSAQAIGAIMLGAATAVMVQLLPFAELAGIATVVAVGTLLSGWRRLGEMASWVPISGLFVLIVGSGDPAHYVAAYLGLTSLGAIAGLLVNGLFPPLPLTATSLTLRRLRVVLADQLDDLADGLLQEEPPAAAEWQARRYDLTPHVAETHRLAQHVAEARRGNWRERHWREAADYQYQHAVTLGWVGGLVEEIVELVIERECSDGPDVALGPGLRTVTARSLAALAAVLRARPEDAEWDEAFTDLLARTEEVRDATRSAWRHDNEDRFTAAAIVVDLERAAQSLQKTGEWRAERRQASSSD